MKKIPIRLQNPEGLVHFLSGFKFPKADIFTPVKNWKKIKEETLKFLVGNHHFHYGKYLVWQTSSIKKQVIYITDHTMLFSGRKVLSFSPLANNWACGLCLKFLCIFTISRYFICNITIFFFIKRGLKMRLWTRRYNWPGVTLVNEICPVNQKIQS